jgi:anti-anti-sigma regulatory factor
MLDIAPVSGPALTADATFIDGVLDIRLIGSADAEAKADLDALIEKVQTEAVRLAATKVTVDLRHLEFMNSSCFHFLSNPEHHWQRRSLAALACFAVDLVAVENVGLR